jgi:hypothetical protein
MISSRFLGGRSSGASSKKRPMSLSFFAPISGRAGHAWAPSRGARPPQRNRTMGGHTDSTIPSCGRRLQFSAFGWFLWCNWCICVDTPMTLAVYGLAHSHRLGNCLTIEASRSLFGVTSFNIHPLGTLCLHRHLHHNGIDSLPRVCARPHGRSPLPIKAAEDLS